MHRLRPWGLALITTVLAAGSLIPPGLALPPEEETPEEVLRTRIITDARSPIDGKPLSAAAYAQLQEQLQNRNDATYVDPDVAELIFLLQVRRGLQLVVPFFP